MLETGNLLYFTPFFFKNGNTAKSKYFIVLHVHESTIVVGSLPTRTDNIPTFLNKKHGCINDEGAQFNCYCFEKDATITNNGFSFPFDTFIYGEQIDTYEVTKLQEIYPKEDIDYEIVGKLEKQEFDAIIDCMKNSSRVKRKIKRML